MLFTGEFLHTIDSKQRLAIPAEVRSRLEREKLPPTFYVVPGPNGSLWLWPEKTFETMAADLEQSLVPGEDELAFAEATFPLARLVEIDSAGRVRVPEELLADAGLGSSVMIIGMRDHLELRDPESWQRDRAERRARQAEVMLRARMAMRERRHSNGGGKVGT